MPHERPVTRSYATCLIHTCAMTHTHIHDSCDSFIYVPWLYKPHERPVTRWYATCLIHICTMSHTHIYDSYGSFIYVPWLYMTHERPMTPSYATWLVFCKKTNDFCQGRFVFKLFDIFKKKTWYHKLLLNAKFSYCGIEEGSVGFRGYGDSDIP